MKNKVKTIQDAIYFPVTIQLLQAVAQLVLSWCSSMYPLGMVNLNKVMSVVQINLTRDR